MCKSFPLLPQKAVVKYSRVKELGGRDERPPVKFSYTKHGMIGVFGFLFFAAPFTPHLIFRVKTIFVPAGAWVSGLNHLTVNEAARVGDPVKFLPPMLAGSTPVAPASFVWRVTPNGKGSGLIIHRVARHLRVQVPHPPHKLFKEQESCGAFDALQCGMVSERSLAVGNMGRGVAPHRGQPPCYPGLGMRSRCRTHVPRLLAWCYTPQCPTFRHFLQVFSQISTDPCS